MCSLGRCFQPTPSQAFPPRAFQVILTEHHNQPSENTRPACFMCSSEGCGQPIPGRAIPPQPFRVLLIKRHNQPNWNTRLACVQLRKVCLTDSPGVVVTKEEWQKVLRDLGLKDMLEVRPRPLPRPGVLYYCTDRSFWQCCGVFSAQKMFRCFLASVPKRTDWKQTENDWTGHFSPTKIGLLNFYRDFGHFRWIDDILVINCSSSNVPKGFIGTVNPFSLDTVLGRASRPCSA